MPYEVAILAPNEWSERGPNRQCIFQLTLTLGIFERAREALWRRVWGGVPLHIQLGGFRKRHKLPQWARDLAPAEMGFEFERSHLEMTL